MKRIHRGGPYERDLEQLLAQVHEQKAALRSMMQVLGPPVRAHKQLAMWVGSPMRWSPHRARPLT